MDNPEVEVLLAAELGDENAPAGTKPWAIATVGVAHDIRYRVGEEAKALRRKIEIIEKFQAHTLLGFQSFDELCIRRLSLSPEQVKAIKDAAPGISIAVALAKHGTNQHTKKDKGEEVILSPPLERGTSREYLKARLNRDYPDIAAQVHAGELSARKGAILAGIIRELSPLEKAQAAFRRLVKEDRDAFDLWRADQPL